VATLTEIYHFLRLLYVKLGTQYCPTAMWRSRRRAWTASRRASCASIAGTASACSPLVVNRKGYYTDLAKWRRRAPYHLMVDDAFIETARWPRLSRFQEHNIELPVADITVSRTTKLHCAPRLLRHRARQGVVHVLATWRARAGRAAQEHGTSPAHAQRVLCKARLPSCSLSFRNWIRAVLLQLAPRLVPACFGTGSSSTPWLDESREKTGTEDHVLDSWLQWLEIDEPCPPVTASVSTNRRWRCAGRRVHFGADCAPREPDR